MKCVSCLLVLVLATGKVDSSCQVADFAVQRNFDIHQYVGVTWYETKLLTAISKDDLYHDYTHNYYLHPDGEKITTYIRGRDGDKCLYYTEEKRTTETAGKWLSIQGDEKHPYWIMSTDYTSYSVVYRCKAINALNECDEPRVWVYSRTQQLPAEKEALVDNVIAGLCINESALLEADQNNECPLDEECAIYSLEKKRKQNFDIQRFVGKWYETSWLPQSYIPEDELFQDYSHIYSLNSDGTVLTTFISGRDPVNLEKCFLYPAQLLQTAEDGKFMYRRKRNSTHFMIEDYWIMSTDYVKYAVVYGCRQLASNGLCTYADSWIWSRTPMIPSDVQASVDDMKGNLCVNTSLYLATQQNNACTDNRDCSVDSIVQKMVTNFTIEDFKGRWYWYSYLSSAAQEPFTDYQIVVSGRTSDDPTSISKSRVRYPNRGGDCEYEDIIVTATDTPGKQYSTRITPKRNISVTSYIMATDYSAYYVAYSCLGEDGDGRCIKPSASLWSRTTELSLEKLTEAKITIMGLCLNYDDFVKVNHSNYCGPEDTSRGFHTEGAFILVITTVWMTFFLKDAA